MARREDWTVGTIVIAGVIKTSGITTYIQNEYEHNLLCSGTRANLPMAKAGYATGCKYICTDTGENFSNVGDEDSSNFLAEEISSSSSSSSSSKSSSSSSSSSLSSSSSSSSSFSSSSSSESSSSSSSSESSSSSSSSSFSSSSSSESA
jgi:hypothetical protein